jgi:hypothetical protein
MDVVVGNNVVSRELLGTAVVSIPQPAIVKKFTTPEDEPYEQFGVPVAGGFINFHLFDRAQCQTRGKKIWVKAQIWKKTMSDGMEFLYVDLRPTEERLTHERKIFQRREDIPAALPKGSIQFNTFGHIRGSLVFIPHDPFVE